VFEYQTMVKKANNQEDQAPFDYFKEVEVARKQEKTSAQKLVTSLRSDMLPASSISPAEKAVFQRVNLKLIVGILFGLVILAIILYFAVGGGRPILENSLASLVQVTATPTKQATSTRLLPSNTPFPSKTPTPSQTPRPTNTPTQKHIASPTAEVITSTPTAIACRDVLSITLDDVGQTLCVQGTVTELINNPDNFMVIFSYQPGAFYWVTYEMVWTKAEVGKCYQTTGEILRIFNSPVLVFDFRNIPEECP
jgi:hypothetical protein